MTFSVPEGKHVNIIRIFSNETIQTEILEQNQKCRIMLKCMKNEPTGTGRTVEGSGAQVSLR